MPPSGGAAMLGGTAKSTTADLEMLSESSVPVQGNHVDWSPTAVQYAEGDHVQVWSKSRNTWLNGLVMAVFRYDTVADGYSVAAGTIKVSSEAGLKWITAEQVESQLRKAPPDSGAGGYPSAGSKSPLSAAAKTTSSGGARFCKNGCGRSVQPGFTRHLKMYDTCCKRCAQHNGANGHDENCGRVRRVSCDRGGCPSEDAHVTNKRLLDTMLSKEDVLTDFLKCVFNYTAKKADMADKGQVTAGVQEMMAMFGIKQEIHDDYITQMCKRFSSDPGGKLLSFADFRRLCRAVLEDRRQLWFPEILPVFTRNFVQKNAKSLKDVYSIGKRLGQGSFGVVSEVTHKAFGDVRVCKQIAKSSPGMDYKQIMQEIHNMAMLDHPNVIKVYEYFEDEHSVIQVMERCKGGELQDKVDSYRKSGKPPYNEGFIRDIMKQTLRALAFMHGIKFLHKDLKPQNIMLVDKHSSSVKVIDFGLAELFKDSQEFATSVGGTLLYMAPEVFKQEMTTKVDVWSAGVILFNLLTADFPFMEQWPPPGGKDQKWWQEGTKEKIKNAGEPAHARLSKWSPQCIDLLRSMLRKDVAARPDAAQCLEHSWFQENCEAPPALSVGVVQCVEAYARMNELKKAIFLLIANQSPVEACPEFRTLFTHFDYRNRGTLSAHDLHHVLVQSGIGGLRAERVLHALDRDSDGQITWTEFIAAAICASVFRNRHCVDSAFFLIDVDGDEKISAEDMVRIFAGAESESQEAWRRRMPKLFQELAKEDGSTSRYRAQASLGQLASRIFSSGKSSNSVGSNAKGADGQGLVSKKQFRTYVGKNLAFRAGDGLYAVQ